MIPLLPATQKPDVNISSLGETIEKQIILGDSGCTMLLACLTLISDKIKPECRQLTKYLLEN